MDIQEAIKQVDQLLKDLKEAQRWGKSTVVLRLYKSAIYKSVAGDEFANPSHIVAESIKDTKGVTIEVFKVTPIG